ncbi:heme ABC transporter ATP-binding protein (plasmid) [Cereibacter azotoformans]|uniref:heme ABC transporter ATP-binding protein n=1 Tax=Cereibacter azotoformans TaxID=43057 RepID=UPI001EECD1F8|nr:heme ABC transporter ATP-binding protein [Cereibacter azotoformans]ULB12432.1 heme ABC transporter ATP-binding protein [Cereibacter azotoformans]
MLRADDISVSLGRARVLEGVGFTACPGEVTAIVGPNGSGKTTLLRAMTGELRHAGRVRLNGHDCAGLKGWEMALLRAVLPQATALAFPFTLAEVVRMGLSAGLHAGRDEVVRAALAAVDLAHAAGRFFQELSGGEQARGHLARALAQVWEPVVDGAPRWLFLDEPVASLDIGHQLQVMDLVSRYAARGGGVVAVMHDLNLTAMFAHRVTLLNKGRVLAEGTPAEVLTDRHLSAAYGAALRVNRIPQPGTVFLLPQVAGGREARLF